MSDLHQLVRVAVEFGTACRQLLRRNGHAARAALFFALSLLFCSTVTGDEAPVVLAPFKVSAISSIEIDIRVSNEKITKLTIISVRKGSPAESAGFRSGMDIVKYRGEGVLGLTVKEFEELRIRPLRVGEPVLTVGVILSTDNVRYLSIPIPAGIQLDEASGSLIDPFVEGITRGPDVVSAYDFLFRYSSPIDLSASNATRRLGDRACEEIMKWQLEPGRKSQDIAWAVPIIKNNKMVGWRIAAREIENRLTASETDPNLADYLRVNYFNLKERPQAYPNIESDIRASFEKSGKFKKGENIGLFSLLVDEQNRVWGFWVGIKVLREDLNWYKIFDRH